MGVSHLSDLSFNSSSFERSLQKNGKRTKRIALRSINYIPFANNLPAKVLLHKSCFAGSFVRLLMPLVLIHIHIYIICLYFRMYIYIYSCGILSARTLWDHRVESQVPGLARLLWINVEGHLTFNYQDHLVCTSEFPHRFLQ